MINTIMEMRQRSTPNKNEEKSSSTDSEGCCSSPSGGWVRAFGGVNIALKLTVCQRKGTQS